MADDVLVMYCGQVVESGPMQQVFHHMLHPYTEGLMNSIPRLSDDAEELNTIDGMVPSLYELPQGCRFHPRCAYALSLIHIWWTAWKPPATTKSP